MRFSLPTIIEVNQISHREKYFLKVFCTFLAPVLSLKVDRYRSAAKLGRFHLQNLQVDHILVAKAKEDDEKRKKEVWHVTTQ